MEEKAEEKSHKSGNLTWLEKMTMTSDELAKGPSTQRDGYISINSVDTKNGEKRILHPMHIDLPEGTITAILGPSGSGKTTLLNVLTNSVPSNIKANGNVQLNGEAGSLSFVPQADALHGFFTCQSYLEHYARLSGMARSDPEYKTKIQDLLKAVGLSQQTKTVVGDLFFKGLSGGQKRRLSVALEVLTQPKTLVLDEPTTGLDAESALQIMEFLKKYVTEAPGRRVILTIHQPSSYLWKLIDHAVLVSNGKLIYQGKRSLMEGFFAQAGHATPPQNNPADHYVCIVNEEFRLHAMKVDEWEIKFKEYTLQQGKLAESDPQKMSPSRSSSFTGISSTTMASDASQTFRAKSFLGATVELTYRYFLSLWFNPGILMTRIVMYTLLALAIGAIFWDLGSRVDLLSIQSRAVIVAYILVFFIFMSIAVLPFVALELQIVSKEIRNSYYHPAAFHMSLVLASIPLSAVLSFLATIIVFPMTGLNNPLWFFAVIFLGNYCAEAMAVLVSYIVPHFVIGMALIAGLYGFFMIFMGFILRPSDFPGWLQWTYWTAYHTYAYRILLYSEFGETDAIFEGPYRTGMDILASFDIENASRIEDMVTLVGYTGIVHLLGFLVISIRYGAFGKQGRISNDDAITTRVNTTLNEAEIVTNPTTETKNEEYDYVRGAEDAQYYEA